jgi:hypothetical protein
MKIGKPKRTITVEPLEDPVPREVPLKAQEQPSDRPHEPAQTPAG